MKIRPGRNPLIRNDLMAMAQSFRPSRLFLSAVELGVFEALHSGLLTAQEMADRIGTHDRATGIFLDALTGLGLLEKHDNAYMNAPWIKETLCGPSSDALTAYFRHQSNSWRIWSSLTEIVKTGRAEKHPPDVKSRIDLAGAMQYGSKETAERLDLMVDFADIRNICDMGCGPGAVCMELLQRHPHLKAVLVDHDKEALTIAKREARSRNLQDRVEIVQDNIVTANTGKNFDMVILSLVLCLFTRGDAILLLEKARTALRTGGVLILGEVLLSNSRTSPAAAALFAMHLLVTGAAGGLFSLDEIRKMLADCGIEYQCNFPANLYHIIIGRNGTN